MLEYVNRGFGMGHVADVTAWLAYSVNAIITAMVAVSFGGYASSLLAVGPEAITSSTVSVPNTPSETAT